MILAFHLRAILVLDDVIGNERGFCMMGKTSAPTDGRFTGSRVVRSIARLFSVFIAVCGKFRSPSSGPGSTFSH